MIHNIAIYGVVLPCPNRTDIQIYDLYVEPKPKPMDILENVTTDGAIDDEFDQGE